MNVCQSSPRLSCDVLKDSPLSNYLFHPQYDSRLFGFLRIHRSPVPEAGSQESKEAEDERLYLAQVSKSELIQVSKSELHFNTGQQISAVLY